MTGEEMERAIEFLLGNQARTDARLSAGFEETNRQIAEINQRLDSFADTQAALMQVATETFAAQNRINEEMRRGYDELRRGQENLQRAQEAAWAAIRQSGTRLDRIEAVVERLAETVRSRTEGGDETSGG